MYFKIAKHIYFAMPINTCHFFAIFNHLLFILMYTGNDVT